MVEMGMIGDDGNGFRTVRAGAHARSEQVEAMEENRDAARLLMGLENGGMSSADAAILAEELDPVFVYIIVTFLRRIYPASDPAASSVLDRVLQMISRSRIVVAKQREGERDPVSQWFESEYSYGDFRTRGAALIDLIWNKLES